MDTNQDPHAPPPPSPSLPPPPPPPPHIAPEMMEVMGDSETDVTLGSSHDLLGLLGCGEDDNDTESCCGTYGNVCMQEGDDVQGGDDDDGGSDAGPTWSTGMVMVRSEWEEEEEQRVNKQAEEDRLFWECCLANGYP